ncbi:2-polyprenyl-6-methoxyphenol hydroxylase-like FAD-dependent oxidoreductase [Actinopolyspora biskrensis]|uniref:2-polyprenyl-6-methoxyphenol hydroxylase-like FAD-dependent oxidoreductase n=1 Tax=Actinopolyspora biskrensis TaxID=1470178 RepID=A0A852ZDX8_9ACTN|nr:FAD-dependent monooxygenase [Actinopolyspora biskrensis]NYH80937.1 2-polyprenyl-6-methoxyphenol hydroxylase-like FAD-dependent oxidoreductase [Actinopolyspora biskrensis]
MRTQVIVVGAGPVGLMLACELRLAGADVVVVERLLEPTGESRASQLNSRTVEVLDQRGLLEALGEVQYQPSGHFGGLPLDMSGVDSVHPGHWKVPQFRTEAVLEERAGDLGAEIWRGHELRDLSVGRDGVEAAVEGPRGGLELRARYLVGCDGERSVVRDLAGFDFPGTGATRELFRADVAGIEVADRSFQRYERGLAISARRPDGVTRVMAHEFGSAARDRDGPPSFEEVAAAWFRITGEDITGGSPIWVDSFGDANRQVDLYRRGNVLLAGDAAHLQMPAGGQALNLGLQEAVNLGWKLAAQVCGRAPEGLLDSYHSERHPVAARVLSNVGAQAHLLLGGPDMEPMRRLLRGMLEFDEVREHLTGMLSGLDVRYDVGGDGHPLLGARLPHCELVTDTGTTSTVECLRAGGGVLLELSPEERSGRDARKVLEPWRRRVLPVTARVPSGGALDGLTRVLVRPDGHVVAVDPPPEELGSALTAWFGAPEPS